MAILNKRSSTATLPGTPPRQATGKPSDKMKAVQKTATRPSAVLTSALKPNASATTSGSSTAKPSVNAGAPTSVTSKVSGTTRPSITRTAAPSNSNAANTLKNALIGAGVGVAGKMAYDKIFGGNTAAGGKGATAPSAVDKVINAVKPTSPVSPSKPVIPVKPTIPAKPTTPTKPTTPAKPTAPTKPPVAPKPPVTPKSPAGGTTGQPKGEETTTGETDVESTGTDAYGGKVNDDGSVTYTYDDGSTITMDADGNIMSSTDATDIEFPSGDVADTGGDIGSDYYQDEYGNVYDGDGNLVYSADGNYTDETVAEEDHSDYVYTDEYGYQYDWDGNVIYDPYAEGEYSDGEYAYDDSPVDIPEDWYADEEYTYDDSEYPSDLDDWWGKKGGLVVLMANGGGVRHFYDGGYSDTGEDVQDWQNVDYNFGEFDEPGLMAGDMTLGGGYARNTYETAPSEVIDTEVFDDGSYIEYMSDGSYVTYDSDGNVYQSSGQGGSEEQLGSEWPAGYVSNGDGTATMVMDDGSTITVDENMNPVYTTDRTDTAITGAGGTGGAGYRLPQQPGGGNTGKNPSETGALSALSNWFKENPTLGAGAAGALVGTLLGDSNLFGGSNEPAPSIDMSKVGVINPRTTDFGVGAPKFVTYNEYSARDQMPELYGDELYRNLNAPGFNPVREGDYGYEAESPDAAQPKMADGGSVDTYFTFGKPVDPLQNLTNPQPAMQGAPQGGLGNMMPQMPKPQMPVQQQQMPQQMPQQGSSMPQSMKRGGLPAVSDVPLAEGRLDFRRGSAVHGPGDGQSDDIPAMLADGEYVIDAETVAQIGNGSTKAGAQALDEFRENIRRHKRSAPVDKIPPKTKTLTSYLKKGK